MRLMVVEKQRDLFVVIINEKHKNENHEEGVE